MTAASCIHTLYHQHLVDTDSATPLDNLVSAYLNDAGVEARLFENVVDWEHRSPHINVSLQGSPWELVDHWRELLTIALIACDTDLLLKIKNSLLERVHNLSKCVLWSEFQLMNAYQHLIAMLLGQHDPHDKMIDVRQLESGAAPMENGGHWAWGDIPHSIFHAELGVLWCLQSALSEDHRTKAAAEALAQWQLNTLDHEYMPFSGLYSQEGDASELSLLMNNYVLFNAVARICSRHDMAYVAEQQSERLAVLMSLPPGPIPIHALVLQAWFERHFNHPAPTSFRLPGAIQDKSMALAGCRLPGCSAVATLYGGGTGMGCFHRGDVQVVNFGPQHLPLGDCRGFGLEGAGRLLASRLRTLSIEEGGFVLEGTGRMAPRPKGVQSLAGFRHGDPSGCWIEARIEVNKGHLCVETHFNGIFDDKSFAFVFFIKASGCIIDGKQVIKPRSFQHYQGEICPVQLKGEQFTVCIEAEHKTGEMRVIPLGGGQNFWGADYLIAYQCHTEGGCYRWQLA